MPSIASYRLCITQISVDKVVVCTTIVDAVNADHIYIKIKIKEV